MVNVYYKKVDQTTTVEAVNKITEKLLDTLVQEEHFERSVLCDACSA